MTEKQIELKLRMPISINEAFAEAIKDYKETNGNCDASKARLFAEMIKNNIINKL